ncbi:MAG: prepilin-type N-terminal cleavage/methylation domain-containing protein [Clostridia bacterium]|nr:prepilin-type N-terminal cleavage/methylation domain-containing protein [Clostridia bacterium]
MNKRGFTIIEIILAVAVSAILSGVVIVSAYRHFNLTSEASLKSILEEMVEKAQLLSCSSGVPVGIYFDRQNEVVSIYSSHTVNDNHKSGNFESNQFYVGKYNLPINVKMGRVFVDKSNNLISENRIVFYPNGFSDSGKVEFEVAKKSISFNISSFMGVVDSTQLETGQCLDLDKIDKTSDEIFK